MVTVRVLDAPPEHDPPPTRSGRLLLIGMAAVIAVLLIALVAVLVTRPGGATTASPAPATTSTTPAATAPTSTPPADPPAQPALEEVVPGLHRGLATYTVGHTSAKYGIPYGWPKTTYGAVGAAMTNGAAFATLPVMVDATRKELHPYMYTPDGSGFDMSDETAAKMRKASRLSTDGVVLLADGRPSPHEKYYGGGLPLYGAYKVLTEDADRVIVEVWMPVVFGPGTDDNISEVHLGTLHYEITMRWTTGPDGPDWRASHGKMLPALKLPSPPRKSNIGYQAIRDLLGPGWMVLADATTEPYPGSVWAS